MCVVIIIHHIPYHTNMGVVLLSRSCKNICSQLVCVCLLWPGSMNRNIDKYNSILVNYLLEVHYIQSWIISTMWHRGFPIDFVYLMVILWFFPLLLAVILFCQCFYYCQNMLAYYTSQQHKTISFWMSVYVYTQLSVV